MHVVLAHRDPRPLNPEMVTAVAFVVDHLSVAASQASTTGGSTVIEAVGPGGVGRRASCKGGGACGATATFFLQPAVSPTLGYSKKEQYYIASNSHDNLLVLRTRHARRAMSAAANVTASGPL